MPSLLLLTLVAAASAGGLYIPDAGVRAAGRGGAYVAGADGAEAISWNPAGLSRADALVVQIDFAAVDQTVAFQREGFSPIHNRAGPQVAPRFGIVAPVGPIAVGFGFWTPWGPLYRYPADGAQRYTLIEATFTQLDWGPSIAWEAGPLAIGGTLALSALRVDETLAATTALGGGDDPQWDVITRVRATDGVAPTGIVGLLVDPGPAAFGASVRLPTTFRARGTLSTDFSENAYYTGEADAGQIIAVATAQDDDVAVPIALPAVARAGVMLRPSETFSVEVAGVWEGWSRFRELRITDLALSVPTTGGEFLDVTDDIVIPAGFRDTWSGRVGVEWERTERMALRGGAFFESGAVPERTRSVAFPDAAKLGYGIGATLEGAERRFAFDLSFSQSFGLADIIDRSTVFQIAIDPLSGDVGFESEVGAGKLSVANHVLAIGIRWKPGRKAP